MMHYENKGILSVNLRMVKMIFAMVKMIFAWLIAWVISPTTSYATVTPVIAAGDYHACEVRSGGELYCWGYNGAGVLGSSTGATIATATRIGGTATYISVTSGFEFSCAIDDSASTGNLYCWGYNSNGQLGIATSDTTNRTSPTQVGGGKQWTQVSAAQGGYHACGITTAGELYCWGANSNGQLGDGTTNQHEAPNQVGSATDWVSVSVGNDFTCGIRNTNVAYCWGNNGTGQLGDNTQSSSSTPVAVYSNDVSAWASISAGYLHACGVSTAGAVWCWGLNDDGELGNNSTTFSKIPVRENSSATDWASVSAGERISCATKTGGSLYCWGANEAGQLGHGDQTGYAYPVRESSSSTSWSSVSAGGSGGFACGFQGTTRYCWGYNGYYGGQLGLGHLVYETSPVQVGSSYDWAYTTTALAVGAGHACAITTSATLYCWGNNDYGQLGNGTTTPSDIPVQVGTATDWVEIVAGGGFTCGIRSGGNLYCWGDNTYGQVGDGTSGNQRTSPTTVTKISGGAWSGVTAGDAHACASSVTGPYIYCWGYNYYGQVGVGDNDNHNSPQSTSLLSNSSAQVMAGKNHTCWHRSHVIKCWGLNDHGQLGDNNNPNNSNSPVTISGSTSNSAILISGGNSSCYTTSGSTYCWGADDHEQLNINNGSTQDQPTQTATESAATKTISLGWYHGCARDANNNAKLYCWGYNLYGELGIGNTTTYATAQQVGSAQNWRLNASGAYESCAVNSNNDLWCWGLNQQGQLGDGNAWKLDPTAP